MRAIRATLENGKVILHEPFDDKGRFDAIVVVLERDPWDATINDPRPRPELARAGEEALKEFNEGKTTPLDPDNLPP